MEALLLDIIYGLSSNIFLVIAIIIASIVSSRKKDGFPVLIVGIVVQGFSVFGTISGMIRNPDVWINSNTILSLAFFALLIIIGFIILFCIKKVSVKRDGELK